MATGNVFKNKKLCWTCLAVAGFAVQCCGGLVGSQENEDALDPCRHPFHIYVGATKAATAAGLPVGKLADEEHVVKTVGNEGTDWHAMVGDDGQLVPASGFIMSVR